jgi:hypothetical protein
MLLLLVTFLHLVVACLKAKEAVCKVMLMIRQIRNDRFYMVKLVLCLRIDFDEIVIHFTEQCRYKYRKHILSKRNSPGTTMIWASVR